MNKNPTPHFRLATHQDIDKLYNIDSINSVERYQDITQWVTQNNCYLIEMNNTIVAYGVIHSDFFGQNFIELLMVNKYFRQKGFGLILINNFKYLCKTSKLFTSTNRSNIATQYLLSKAGFIASGIIENLDEDVMV